MKKLFSSKMFRTGNTIASFALVAGFAAFLVFVVNPSVDGGRLGAQAGKGGATVPDAPLIDTLTPGDGEVALVWSEPRSNGGATIVSYNVRYTDGRNSNTVNTGRASTSYTVTGLTNETSYSFSVAAVNSVGASAYSTAKSATPVASVVSVPSVPTDLSATAADGEIALAWTAPVDDGGAEILNYVVSYTPAGGSETLVRDVRSTSYTLSRLTNNTEYSIRVAAENSQGVGDYTASVTATPLAVTATPGAPTNLSVSTSSQTVRLSWVAPADDGGSAITGYTISYTPQGGSEITVDAGNSTSYSITGLTNGTRYSVKVLARNENGSGTYSSTTSARPSTIPGVPSEISTTPGDKTLSISWTAPADGGSAITGYTISYIPTAGGSETTVEVPGASTSYTLEDLTNSVSYTIKVLATNANGDGSYSSTVTGIPDENVAPTIVGAPSVTPGSTSAVVAWSTNKRTIDTRVNFGLLTVARSTPTFNRNTGVVNHEVTISDLVPCTTYSYTVYSKDALNQEITSSKQTFTTTGCVATVEEIKVDAVDTTTGGTLDFAGESDEVKTKLVVPANLKAGETDVVFQVKKLEKETTKTEIGKPNSRVEWLGEHVYNFTAYGSESEEVNNFDNPINVTIEYAREDVQGIDLNTLKIHHYEEGIGWRELSSCTNNYNPNTGSGEITCLTESFSVFGLFGESASGGSSTGTFLPAASASSTSVVSKTNDSESEDVKVQAEDMQAEEDTVVKSNLTLPTFSQDLKVGLNNSWDVLNLQKFLNAQGFVLADKGPGSPGRETSYFGERTQNALKRFQEKYSEFILKPLGKTKPTGYLDSKTREFIENNF